MRVIIAIDDTPASHHIIEACAKRRWPVGSQFKVLTIVEPLSREFDEWSDVSFDINHKRMQKAETMCRNAQEKLETDIPESVVHYEVKEGNPKSEIVASAVKWCADTIVLGAYSREMCPHNIPGGVAHAVSNHAPCTVEVIRPKVKPKDTQPEPLIVSKACYF